MYLPEGPARPNLTTLGTFFERAMAASPSVKRGADYQVRWIGLDAPTTQQIIDLIKAKDKTGTFTLPWIVERTDQPAPCVGDHIILINFDGTPELLVRLTDVYQVKFGAVTAKDIAIDGSPVRDLAIWKPMHTVYWNNLLKPFNLTVSGDMPVWVETFELLFPRA
jgi:uncharacterized protein YhfF